MITVLETMSTTTTYPLDDSLPELGSSIYFISIVLLLGECCQKYHHLLSFHFVARVVVVVGGHVSTSIE